MSIKKATINIKDLPQTLEITDGDFLVVEQYDGTYILDYADLILEPEKTAISTLVYSLETDVADLSTSLNARIDDLSAYVDAATTKVYIGKATVKVTNGTTESGMLEPRPSSDVPEITPTDFIVTPADAVAGRFPGYISSVDDSSDNRGYFSITASFYRTTLTANTATGEVVTQTQESTSEELLAEPSYNVMVIKSY
jgi:hypothetical protein